MLFRSYLNADGRTMVPVRFIAERMQAQVTWDATTKQVSITLGERKIQLTIDSKTYLLNGEAKETDTAPVIEPGLNRTMVPLRLVSEALGLAVEWEEAHQLVYITPADRPWDLTGSVEEDARAQALYLISPLLRDFI